MPRWRTVKYTELYRLPPGATNGTKMVQALTISQHDSSGTTPALPLKDD